MDRFIDKSGMLKVSLRAGNGGTFRAGTSVESFLRAAHRAAVFHKISRENKSLTFGEIMLLT